MNGPLKIQIIIGSTRKGRFGEKPARYAFDELGKKEGVEAEVVDLRDWPLPFFDEASSPMRLAGNYESDLAKKWAAKIGEADGYIMTAAEYNHGYTAVLKNAIDWVYREWNDKPVGFIGYGSVGGSRAIEQLRQVVIQLKMRPISNAVHIPMDVYRSVAAAEAPVDPELFAPIRKSPAGDLLEMFFDELLTLARKLRSDH